MSKHTAGIFCGTFGIFHVGHLDKFKDLIVK